MAEARITHCPFCSTSFRVTETQLSVANGSVRCGSCLRVFMAELYFMDSVDGGSGEANEQASVVQSGEDESEQGQDGHQQEHHQQEHHHKGNGQQGNGKEGHRRQVLQKVQEQLNEKQKIRAKSSEKKQGKAKVEQKKQVKPEEKSESDELLEALISEEENKWDERIPSLSLGEAVKEIQSGLDWDKSDVVLDKREKNYIQRVVDVDRYESFRQEITQRFRGYNANGRWFVFSLLLVLTLFLQHAWFHRDSLSMDPDYRVWYEKTCNYFNCVLPDYLNLTEIRATDLVIRPHTEEKNALIIDALLRNDSRFRQAFPDLDLQFRTIKNEVLAHRQFTASEYLKGELAGLKYIPPKTEVRLALEIVDPGEEAVNYSLQIIAH